ncbi:MAG: DEAD/DEAH box helicase [Proteobacteria bacterium]|nr:DEAD/DEAH box helicase [Pseudomonadota bacterium]
MHGRVLEFHALDDSGWRWGGKVRGSARKPYQCEATLTPDSDRRGSRMRSHCSCPVGTDCKHVAALLYAISWEQEEDDAIDDKTALGVAPIVISVGVGQDAAEDGPDLPESLSSAELAELIARATQRRAALLAEQPDPMAAWRPWLAQVDPPAPAAATPAADIGLLVRAETFGEPPGLLVALVHFQTGRQGQRIAPKNVNRGEHLPREAPAGGWPDTDLAAASLLLERPPCHVGGLTFVRIHGRALELAFQHLLGRYPAFWEKAAQPLRCGPERGLQLQWQEQADGSQRLVCVIAEDRGGRLLQGDGLWYADVEHGELGRIGAGEHLFELARRAPVLAPEASQALQAALAAQTGAPIPPPRVHAAPLRIQAEPIPVLRLSQQTVQPMDQWNRSVHLGVAEPGFIYAGQRIPGHGAAIERRQHEGRLLDLVRDIPAEVRWRQRWVALDLLPLSRLGWQWSHVAHWLGNDLLLFAPGAQRQPQPPERWHELLATLEAQGVRLEYADDFPRPRREIEVAEWDAELVEAGNAWFDLRLGIDVEGERIDLLPILHGVLADPKFPLQAAPKEPSDATWSVVLDDQRALRLPLGKLRELIAPLLDWLQAGGALRLHRSQRATLDALAGTLHWRGDETLRQRLLDLAQRPQAVAPPGFTATLRPYQCEGLAWLNLLGEAGLGGVLADDMGLGKTVQVLAHLLAQRQRQPAHKTLVVAPTSLMGNWHDEAARFAPALRTLVLHGPERGQRFDAIAEHDLVLTTYPLLARDRERLLEQRFDLLVLDEAQAIKNARSQAAQVVRELPATRRLAMTGTPLENHLGELWAQFDAIEPGLLGNERAFNRLYRTPIEKHRDADRQQRLNRRIAPLLLRRRKDEVLAELPPKTEIVRRLELEGAQRELYETLRLAQHERVREAIAQRGLAQSGIVVLDALLKLRQACCDPRLLKLPAARKVKASAKLDALLELLATLREEGRRVLLFSQFTGMLDLIEKALDRHAGLRGDDGYLRLDGDTPEPTRAGIVRRFQSGKIPLLLISLKAGGVGLNLTAADTVIHYDPWWNPAVENQATDRAHRIGQDKPVFVYKLICADTVEDRILAMQQRKAELAKAVLEGGRSTGAGFNERDLDALFGGMG